MSHINTAQKMKFSLRISSVNVTIFTEEILNGKVHFLCSVNTKNWNVTECALIVLKQK